MLRPLYNWTMRQAAGPRAPWVMGAVSFAESSFFPLPPDIVLIPLVVAKPQYAWRYALICTLTSVVGGVFGYGLGYFFQDAAQTLLRWMGSPDALAQFQRMYNAPMPVIGGRVGMWVILIKGLTPIPYKLVTIASGLAHFSFWVFLVCSLITRGGRFFLWTWVLKRYGPAIMPIIERRLYTSAAIAIALLVGGFLVIRFI